MTVDTSPENVTRMLEGVTPGPWEHDPEDKYQFNVYSDDTTGSIVATTTGFEYAPRNPAEKLANARFVAYAREAVPALAARVAEVEAERDSFRAVLEGARYSDIEGIGKNTVEMSRMLGEAVMQMTEARRYRAEAAEARVAKLTEVLDRVMIGGNHLTTWLPENAPAPTTPPLNALEMIGAGYEYDVWCCWATIMNARALMTEVKP